MRASTQFFRTLIRSLQGSANPAAFAAALKTVATDSLTTVRTGRILIGVGSSGTQASFSLPPIGSLGHADVMEAAEELLTATEEIIADAAPATTAELVTALLTRFIPVYATRPDFTALQR